MTAHKILCPNFRSNGFVHLAFFSLPFYSRLCMNFNSRWYYQKYLVFRLNEESSNVFQAICIDDLLMVPKICPKARKQCEFNVKMCLKYVEIDLKKANHQNEQNEAFECVENCHFMDAKKG